MARLLEYQGKQLLADAGVAIPRGRVASSSEAVERIAEELGGPVAIKAQIRQGRRGKAGGIKFGESPRLAAEAADGLIGMNIGGAPVREVLVEERLDIVHEFFLGIIVSGAREWRCPVVILSSDGGVEIEDVPDDRIARTGVDVLMGFRPFQGIDLARRAGIPPELRSQVGRIAAALYRVFEHYDCRTIEINPLVVTSDGAVVAADCRAAIDDGALYRHPELGIEIAREMNHEPTLFDEIAWSIEEGDLRGTGYVAQMTQDIDSVAEIGYHGIGGGGAILGVDALNRAGLRVANYADTSGNPTAAKVYRVAKLILAQPGIDGYCLGGFIVANQEQWHHAHGVVKALREELPGRPGFPAVLLLCGNGEAEAQEILQAGLADLPARIEIYGRDRVYDTDFIAARMRTLVDDYRAERGRS